MSIESLRDEPSRYNASSPTKGEKDKNKTPPDVEPGSDADLDRSGLDEETAEDDDDVEPILVGDGKQIDDNIDDLGRPVR